MNIQKQVSLILLLVLSFFIFWRCQTQTKVDQRLGIMTIPKDNPQSAEKIELGRRLFFDKRLSADNSVSCASCHSPVKAFTDGKKVSVGLRGLRAMRNAPTLLNVGYQHTLMFDGQVPSLEMQVLVPLKDSNEMGNDMKVLIQKMKDIPYYQQQAKKIFDRDFDAYVLTRSIAAYERTLLSFQTPFDDFFAGNKSAISESAARGWKLFSKKLYCTECHAPPHFTSFKTANNGLYTSYENHLDKGRFRIDGDSSEIGSFKVPTLRNILKTGPYMHDGSISSLLGVIDHYAQGGKGHTNQDPRIQPFVLSTKERKDLMAFFESLSDSE